MLRFPSYRFNNVTPPPDHSHCNKPCPNSPSPKPSKKSPPKKKFDFKSLKKDTCSSLNDVEDFLCDFSTFLKYIKFYNLLKK